MFCRHTYKQQTNRFFPPERVIKTTSSNPEYSTQGMSIITYQCSNCGRTKRDTIAGEVD